MRRLCLALFIGLDYLPQNLTLLIVIFIFCEPLILMCWFGRHAEYFLLLLLFYFLRFQSNMCKLSQIAVCLWCSCIFSHECLLKLLQALLWTPRLLPCQLLLAKWHWSPLCIGSEFVGLSFIECFTILLFSYINGYQKALWTQCSGGLWIISCSSVAACQCDVLRTLKMCMKCNGLVITVTL